MDLYLVEQQGFDYKELDLNVNDFLSSFPDEFSYADANNFVYLNISLAGFWPLMKTTFQPLEGEKNLTPDISTWMPDGTLLLSPEATRYIGDNLAPYGEILPILVDGKEWAIFNCLSTSNLEDFASEDNSQSSAKSIGSKMLFKCINPEKYGLYCNSRFKQLIEDYGLHGLEFTAIE